MPFLDSGMVYFWDEAIKGINKKFGTKSEFWYNLPSYDIQNIPLWTFLQTGYSEGFGKICKHQDQYNNDMVVDFSSMHPTKKASAPTFPP